MRLRQLVLACGLTSFVLSPYASALGLGEVKLKSMLNQPLEAEVKLLDTRDLTAEQILVSLASPADFERNGVDRLYFYTEFQFQIDLASSDGPKVIIRSRNPVREPYLNFLIEARWTAGRLLREYTLLMDLPTFDEAGSVNQVQAAVTRSTPQAQQPNVRGTASSTVAPGRHAESGNSQSGSRTALEAGEYEVRSNDTLWEIALRARSDSSISVHQSMMALYRANPEAFINGNINKLRRGQILRIPEALEMKSLPRSEAVSQFAQATGDSNFGAQLNASRRTTSTRSESTETSGRVKLAAPSSGVSGSGQGSGANNGSGRALESELAGTLEELDKSKAENTELSSRVKDLEAQIETMERLVEVSNEKLRALQVAAVQSGTGASMAADESVAQAAAVVSSKAAVSSSAAVVAQPLQPSAPKKVILPPPPAPTIVDVAIENGLWIGLGILGLAGAGFFAYRRRKQAGEQQLDEQDDVFAMDEVIDDQELQVDGSEQFDQVEEASLFEEDNEESAVAETGDVVGEADIYIAYGKLDQAEEMLVNALQKDPESTDIRMKLLEVYAQQENVPAFDKHYAFLVPLAGDALLARASELRAGIAGAGEFEAGGESAASSPVDEYSLDDFDLDDESSLAYKEIPAPVDLGGEFNFDLDDDSLSVEEDMPSPASAIGELDFDLDLDDKVGGELISTEVGVDSSDEFDLDLDDELALDSEADDLSELSLALDELKVESLPDDVEVSSSLIDEEFNFDLDDDLDLGGLSEGDEESIEVRASTEVKQEANNEGLDSLEVAADDFNLDMDVDDIDLAALDHEMESLDVDFGDDLLVNDLANVVDGGSEPDFDESEEFELASSGLSSGLPLADDLSATSLSLTDDLDKPKEDLSFVLDDDVTSKSVDDNVIEVDADEESIAQVEKGLLDSAEEELSADFDLDDDLDLSSFDVDSEFEALDEGAIDISDDELDISDDELDVVDADSTAILDAASEEQAGEIESALIAENADDEPEEDLFAQALSDFSGEDDIDLNEFSSDETTLADLSEDDMDAELDFLADADEAATKLDLARAYIDMGDVEGAKDILSEVLGEGNDEQRKEAGELLGRIG
jgi:pilus assembly protein FimV